MKNQLLVVLFTMLSVHCFSQTSFQKGYYITDNGEKVECEIKNIDWKNNPTEFEFRLSENGEQSKENIKTVKEFGIYNYSKYIRSTVDIDRSSKNLKNLTTSRYPVFNAEELFLKVLVDGKFNLYEYEDGNLVRFFYSKEDPDNIEQLVFKTYKTSGDLIGENNRFKQQLLNDLKCDQIESKDINKASYDKKDLVNLFVSYNQCGNSNVVNFEEKQDRDLFNLSLRLGINSSSLAVENSVSNINNVDFGNKTGLRVALEAEFILPFNNDRWAIIAEPTYQSFKSEKETATIVAETDYASVELPIGIRHYFFLNDNSKLFVNGSLILDITNKSTVSYSTGTELDISNTSNLGLGLGYKQNDKYSVEVRYHTNREVLSSYKTYNSDYKTVSLIFGYSFF
jgi:hypothetical protein